MYISKVFAQLGFLEIDDSKTINLIFANLSSNLLKLRAHLQHQSITIWFGRFNSIFIDLF